MIMDVWRGLPKKIYVIFIAHFLIIINMGQKLHEKDVLIFLKFSFQQVEGGIRRFKAIQERPCLPLVVIYSAS